MSGQLHQMLFSYGEQESDCISRASRTFAQTTTGPLSNTHCGGRPKGQQLPLEELPNSGTGSELKRQPRTAWEGVGAPPQECSAICNLRFARRSRAACSLRSEAKGRSIPEEG